VAALARALTAAEREHADRFRRPRDRRRFIAARGLLRRLLGAYLDVDPGQVRLAYGDRGKPHLAEAHDRPALHFNLSHSDGLALYAFARGRRLGIDLERVRPFPEIDRVVTRAFPAEDRARFRAAPPADRLALFYARWTRLEAYRKATGWGFAPGGPQPGEERSHGPAAAETWSLRPLYPGPGYAAALAVEGTGWAHDCWQLEG
jgi:4'-phosphopantetheinyl transferase